MVGPRSESIGRNCGGSCLQRLTFPNDNNSALASSLGSLTSLSHPTVAWSSIGSSLSILQHTVHQEIFIVLWHSAPALYPKPPSICYNTDLGTRLLHAPLQIGAAAEWMVNTSPCASSLCRYLPMTALFTRNAHATVMLLQAVLANQEPNYGQYKTQFFECSMNLSWSVFFLFRYLVGQRRVFFGFGRSPSES